LAIPTTAEQAGVQAVCFSLSHKRFDVSYYEIDPMGRAGLPLRTTIASADGDASDFAEFSISRCETASGLCDRLVYALPALGVTVLLPPTATRK
jgi:hypothetical protein